MRTPFAYVVATSLQRDTFASPEEAKEKLTRYRRDLVTKLRRAAKTDGLRLGSSPESLAAVEEWSFQVRRSDRFDSIGFTPGELTEALHFYAGEVCVRHTQAKWIIDRDDLDPMHYALALRTGPRHTLGYFERIPEASTAFWDDPGRRNSPSSLLKLFEIVRDSRPPEAHPNVQPFARRLARGPRRVYQMALLRAGLSPWSESDLIRAYREYPSGAVRAFALECLGEKGVAGKDGTALLEQVVQSGKFWEHRCAAAHALAKLLGRSQGPLLCALFTESPARHRPPLAALLRRWGTSEAISPVCDHVLELTRRKRPSSSNARELADCLAYLERVGKRHLTAENTFAEVQRRWKRLTPADEAAIRGVVRRFAAVGPA